MKPAEEMRAWHVNSSMPENQSPGEFVLFSVFGFFKKTKLGTHYQMILNGLAGTKNRHNNMQSECF